MKVIRLLIKLLPEKLRHRLIRRIVRTPDHSNNKIIYRIASTKEELESAFRLLHDCYAATGFIAPQPHGLRCTLFSILPNTTIVIAKKGDEVIGTLSLIRDSSLGFPSDKDFKNENDLYRKQGAQMVEVSALAVNASYRKTKYNSQISMYLMKYLYEYTSKHMGCDTLCVAVHPKAYDFYKGLMNFKKNGKVIEYKFVRGALAIHMTGNMDSFRNGWAAEKYSLETVTNVGGFLTSPCPEFMEFPKVKTDLLVNPVITKEMLQYFAMDKTSLLTDELTGTELSFVQTAYQTHFDTSFMGTILSALRPRDFRYPTQVTARLVLADRSLTGALADISPSGVFFRTNELLDSKVICTVIFKLDNHAFKIKASVCWLNDKNNLRAGGGFGISFDSPNPRIREQIRSCHLNYKIGKAI